MSRMVTAADYARLRKIEKAAKRCAHDGCGNARIVDSASLWCPDIYPDDTDAWCWSCILRAALAVEDS